MATLNELVQANANFEEQMRQWKQQRFANGEDPMDWTAFRAHLQSIGAPDPGESAPDAFQRWDDSVYGGEPDNTDSTGWTAESQRA